MSSEASRVATTDKSYSFMSLFVSYWSICCNVLSGLLPLKNSEETLSCSGIFVTKKYPTEIEQIDYVVGNVV